MTPGKPRFRTKLRTLALFVIPLIAVPHAIGLYRAVTARTDMGDILIHSIIVTIWSLIYLGAIVEWGVFKENATANEPGK